MIRTAYYTSSSPDVAKCPASHLPEYAFIGRSNVGKSSLINMLTRQDGLAKTSSKPGKTLLINHFLINGIMQESSRPAAGEKKQRPTFLPQADSWYLVDLPGYGFARAGQVQREALRVMIERYCLQREQLISLFVLLDCRHKPQKIDLEFMQWLGEQGIPFAIVFTKADKLGRERLKWNVDDYRRTLSETWETLPPIFVTSSESRQGGEELIRYIEEINLSLKNQPE